MRSKRFVAVAMVATTLAIGTLPARSEARGGRIDVSRGVGRKVGHDLAEDVGIGLGITTAVVALVGGAIWYYVHNRRKAVGATVTGPAPGTDPAPSAN